MDKTQTNYPKITTLLMILFVITAIFLFYKSVFINDKGKVIYPRYLPENKFVGNDLFIDLRFATNYFINHQTAYYEITGKSGYIPNCYPPLFTFYLYPLVTFGLTQLTSYYIVAGLIIASFILSVVFLPMLWFKKLKIPTVISLVMIASIISYGLQFELERGQFNTISFALCLLSIYIFWFIPKYRWLAYILFFISFQFKVFPIFFLPCFITDIRKLKENIIRIGGILVALFAGMFVMGMEGFLGFIRASTNQVKTVPYIRDHGLSYGIDYLLSVLKLTPPESSIVALKIGLTILGLLAILYVVFRYIRELPNGGFYPPLIMACTIGALAVLPISKDYKLAMMPPVFVIYILYINARDHLLNGKRRLIHFITLGLFSLGNFVLIFSYAYRPAIIQNSFPILYGMLLLVLASELIWQSRKEKQTEEITADFVLQQSV